MASTSSASSSSVQKSFFKYDVFLSFRGEDTRKTFVDHLYHAIHNRGIITYKDDERIQKGERISEQLITSIEESRIYIIVFSKNYASSSWCLEELVHIMDCQKKTEHTAYPVFFDVEPTEVRNQSGAIGEAFAKHVEKEGVGRWRSALKEAASLSGWELKNTVDGHEAKFIQEIVKNISLKIHFINPSIDRKLVGMETRVRDVVSSLEIDSDDDVRMIGIWGMGGGGKTTLARAVFDYISVWFEGKSFVENVREVSKGSLSGLKELQKQILSTVLNDQSIVVTSVSDGKNMMKKMMPSSKVLVVLDDVDDTEQLEALAGDRNWFKPGSRIIITTRDEQVLVAHGANFVHDVSLLSPDEAICLFSRYAFERETPKQGYEELSGKVIHYAAGLPLTIKVLGSHLYGRSESEWKDAIKRLKRIPLKKTLEKLELSYNGLENDEKEIFLDVVCILKGEKKDDAIKILQSCGFNAHIGLRVLEQKSLITISEFNCLGLHDHIEEMGRNIVRRLHPDEPKRHSRLWINDEIEDILVNELGNEEIKCIKLKKTNLHPSIIMKGLRKMKELRFLYLRQQRSQEVDEANHYLPDALRSLDWSGYPFCWLPQTFQANKLVNLEMPYSNVTQLWEGGERKVLNNLKFLDLSNSMLKMLDLSMTPHLEELNLNGCYKFVELYVPFEFPNLKYLDLSGSKVSSLNLGLIPNLERLHLEGCFKFVELHMPFEFPNLKGLNLSCSRVSSLNLGLTPHLEELNLKRCNEFVELHVPFEFPNLKYLNLSGSKVSSLNLGMTPDLERLYLEGCYCLQEIHAPVGCLKKLVFLDLDNCSRFEGFTIKKHGSADLDSISIFKVYVRPVVKCQLHPNVSLPLFWFACTYDEPGSSWSGNLEKLICFGPCTCAYLEYVSATVWGLQHLRELRLDGSIPEVPKDLWQLQSLEKLTLRMDEIQHLPDWIYMLKPLKYLQLNSCRHLEQLPDNICRLECLEELNLVFCQSLRDIPDNICQLKHLKGLDLSCCTQIEKLPEDLGRLECLEELDIGGCKSLRDIPNSICKMKRLKGLDLSYCTQVEKLPEDLGRLECLEELNVRDCKSLGDIPNSICKMKCLKRLNLSYCSQIEKLPEKLGHLECLKELAISATGISRLPRSIYQLKGLLIIGSKEQLHSYGFTFLREHPEFPFGYVAEV